MITLITIYLIGAIGTLAFCIHIGLEPKREWASAVIVFLGWPATLLTFAAIAIIDWVGSVKRRTR